MAQNTEINCHFVTRTLVEPWEYEPGSLRYFDFSTGKIQRAYTRSLFAKQGTNAEEIEKRLSKFMETPIGILKKQFLEGKTDISDWAQYRAFFLYFTLQAARFAKAHKLDEKVGTAFDSILKDGEPAIDLVAKTRMEEYELCTVNMPEGFILFFPQIGYFQFGVEDKQCITGFTFGFAVPITPFTAVAMVPNTANFDVLYKNRHLFQGYSVGLNSNDSKILVPKIVIDNNKEENLGRAMRDYRENGVVLMKNIQEVRSKVVEMYEKVGLSVGPRKKGGDVP